MTSPDTRSEQGTGMAAAIAADLHALLADPARVADVPSEAIPALLDELCAQEGRLRNAQTVLAARLAVALGKEKRSPELALHPLLSAEDVARALGVPRSFVYELIRKGTLPATAIGKYRRVDP